jgi:hypothetical protein
VVIRLIPLLIGFYMATATATRPRRARVKKPRWPEWVGSWPRLTGRQEPEFESKHPGDESEGDAVGIFGLRIGLRCMPWEWLTVRVIHSRQRVNEWGERLWTHRDVVIECTRQQGKTLIIVLVILWRLAKYGDRIVYTAQRWSTARDVFDRTVTVINRVPSLRRRLLAKPSKADNRGLILFRNGGKAEFGPRSQDFARGYTEVDLLIVDEAYDVDPGQEANLTGSQSAAQNPQTIYISTSPVADLHPNCQILAGLHRLGHAHAPDLYYAIYAAPAHMSRDDRAAWAMAQPSYGVATNEREIRSKRQKAKTAAQLAIFDADYLGWGDYPPEEGEGERPIDPDMWADLEGRPVLVGDYVVAIDREPRGRKRWAVVAGRRTADGRVFGEVGYWRSAKLGEVAVYLSVLVELWDPVAILVDDRSAAKPLVPYVRELGIEIEVTGTVTMALACGGLVDAVEGGDVAHGGQPVVADAIESVTKRELPRGDFAWDTTSGAIAPLVAFTLVYWGVLEFAGEQGPVAMPSTGGASGPGHVEDMDVMHDLDVLGTGF